MNKMNFKQSKAKLQKDVKPLNQSKHQIKVKQCLYPLNQIGFKFTKSTTKNIPADELTASNSYNRTCVTERIHFKYLSCYLSPLYLSWHCEDRCWLSVTRYLDSIKRFEEFSLIHVICLFKGYLSISFSVELAIFNNFHLDFYWLKRDSHFKLVSYCSIINI